MAQFQPCTLSTSIGCQPLSVIEFYVYFAVHQLFSNPKPLSMCCFNINHLFNCLLLRCLEGFFFFTYVMVLVSKYGLERWSDYSRIKHIPTRPEQQVKSGIVHPTVSISHSVLPFRTAAALRQG